MRLVPNADDSMTQDQKPAEASDALSAASLLAQPAWVRVFGAVMIMAVVWLLIAWAVSLP